MMPWGLLWRFRKALAAVLLAAIIVGWLLAYRHSLIAAGIAQGKAYVQSLWDAETASLKAAADAASKANAEKDAADAARNQEVANAHAKELAAAAADTGKYRRLLQQARQAATASGRCPAPEGADLAGAADPGPEGSAGEADATARLDAIEAAVADLMAEARANASQLDALIAQIEPQMKDGD